VRETLAGSDGCDFSTAGTGEARGTATAIVGDGAWHEPPQPQSKSMACVGADTIETFGSALSLLVANVASAVLATAIPWSHTIPPAAPSNELSSGS
jgi:hypothetical protein